MAKKRERLEVIYDIVKAVADSNNQIKPTRLLYDSNLSPQMFKDYVEELTRKEFIREMNDAKTEKKFFSLTDKGFEFIEQYKTILQFIDQFGL